MATTSLAPIRKVWSGGLVGAAATVVLWLVSLTGADVPTVVSAAITALVTAGMAYLVPSAPSEAAPPPEPPPLPVLPPPIPPPAPAQPPTPPAS